MRDYEVTLICQTEEVYHVKAQNMAAAKREALDTSTPPDKINLLAVTDIYVEAVPREG